MAAISAAMNLHKSFLSHLRTRRRLWPVAVRTALAWSPWRPLVLDRHTRQLFPFPETIFADGAYGGAKLRRAMDDAAWRIEVVKRSAQAKGFEVIPRRWVVERTIAWINRCRRLAKDYENLYRTAIAFIRLASIRLMLRRLTRYCYPS